MGASVGQSATAVSASYRVLVIDDQSHVTKVLKIFFTRAGYEVDMALNAENDLCEALDSDPARSSQITKCNCRMGIS